MSAIHCPACATCDGYGHVGSGGCSPEDCAAEGVRCWCCGGPIDGTSEEDCGCFHTRGAARDSFEVAWNTINGTRAPWAINPTVWAITFRRINPGQSGGLVPPGEPGLSPGIVPAGGGNPRPR